MSHLYNILSHPSWAHIVLKRDPQALGKGLFDNWAVDISLSTVTILAQGEQNLFECLTDGPLEAFLRNRMIGAVHKRHNGIKKIRGHHKMTQII